MMQKEIFEKAKVAFPQTNINAIPKVLKITINVGAGKVTEDPKFIEKVTKDIVKITGQKPVITLAKKSISGFKIRQGMPIGIKVTLRGKRMNDFLSKLINIVMPRIRDFRGVKAKAVDSEGNINIGIKEHIVFPEIEHDKVEKVFGLQVNITTSAKNKEDAKKLMQAHGMVFQNNKLE